MKIVGNVFSEAGWSYVANPAAFTFTQNAWLNEAPPTSGSDVRVNASVPHVTNAVDARALVGAVGKAPSGTAPAIDYARVQRATTPTRGAFEK